VLTIIGGTLLGVGALEAVVLWIEFPARDWRWKRRFIAFLVATVLGGGSLLVASVALSGGSHPVTTHQPRPGPQSAEERATAAYEFVLDTSSRMSLAVYRGETESKLAIATDWIKDKHEFRTPDGTRTALRTFGEGSGLDCRRWTKPRIRFRLHENNVDRFNAIVPTLKPSRPKAPLGRAIIGGVGDILKGTPPGGKRVFFIVTGGYDTCWVDLDSLIEALGHAKQSHVRIKTYIVGAGLDPGDRQGVKRLVSLIFVFARRFKYPVEYLPAKSSEQFQSYLQRADTEAAQWLADP
jgi:glycosyltransferase involved in cell wall biosynthesis